MRIKLNNGKIVLIDGSDFSLIANYNWYANKNGSTFYALTNVWANGKRTTLQMHRLILGLTNPKILTDHIDGNGLNNQRSNLRKVNRQGNNWNRRKQRGRYTSNYKCVYWDKQHRSWRVSIKTNYKQIHVGRFPTEKEAALAYNEAVVELRPKNFIQLNDVK